jgi:phosphatidylglycerol:prolipoprotein diacylglycerol transferase
MGLLHLRVGGLQVPTHELFVVLGAALAFAVYLHQGRRRGMADRAHVAVAVGALLSGALVAKGATGWRYLLEADEPTAWGLLAFGGKSILGGLFGAYAGALLTKRLVGIRHSTGDLFAPAVAAGMAVGRIGCLLTEPPGTTTSLPWAVSLSPAQAAAVPGCTAACTLPSHPAHAYEIAFHLLSLVLVLRYGDRLGKRGVVFTAWLLAYGVFRLGNEALRPNPDLLLGLSGSQVFLLVGIPLLARALWRTHRRGLLRPPPAGARPLALPQGSP